MEVEENLEVGEKIRERGAEFNDDLDEEIEEIETRIRREGIQEREDRVRREREEMEEREVRIRREQEEIEEREDREMRNARRNCRKKPIKDDCSNR